MSNGGARDELGPGITEILKFRFRGIYIIPGFSVPGSIAVMRIIPGPSPISKLHVVTLHHDDLTSLRPRSGCVK